MELINEYTLRAARFAKIRSDIDLIKRQLPHGCSVDLTFQAGNKIHFEIKDTISRRFLGVLTEESLVDNKIPSKDLAKIQDARNKIVYHPNTPTASLRPKVTAASIEQQNESRLQLKQEHESLESHRQAAHMRNLAPKPGLKKQADPEQAAAAAAAAAKKKSKEHQHAEYTPHFSPFQRVTPFS